VDAADPLPRPGPTRRVFLARAARVAQVAGVGVAAGGLGPLLAACDPRAAAQSAAVDRVKLPDPRRPVRWPVSAANPPLAGGLRPERHATLRVLAWAGRLNPRCLDAFGRRYRCRTELTTFAIFGHAMAALQAGRERYDVLLGAPTYMVGRLVWRGLVQPLNHSYLPNVTGVWPYLTDPYYDLGLRYTVPYTVYTTGFGWRRDLLEVDPYALGIGWDLPWTAAALAKGKIAILDDYRESIGLALLRGGITDLSTGDPEQINQATASLLRLDAIAAPLIDNDTAADLASGRTWLHLAWSGQVAAAARLLPKHVPAESLGYWFPPDGVGPVSNDTGTVLRGARSPVLAHLLLNDLLNDRTAMTNIAGTGFMQPLNRLSPRRLVDAGALPKALANTCVLPTYVDHGLKELQLPESVDELWAQGWNAVIRRSCVPDFC